MPRVTLYHGGTQELGAMLRSPECSAYAGVLHDAKIAASLYLAWVPDSMEYAGQHGVRQTTWSAPNREMYGMEFAQMNALPYHGDAGRYAAMDVTQPDRGAASVFPLLFGLGDDEPKEGRGSLSAGLWNSLGSNEKRRRQIAHRKEGGTANRNALRSVSMITDTFAHLIREQSFSRITVTEVMRRANLARNTFYAHYSSTDELLKDFVSVVVRRVRSNLREISPYADPRNPHAYLLLLMGKVDDDSRLLLERIFVPNDSNRRCLMAVIRNNSVPVLYEHVERTTGCSNEALRRYVDFTSELTMTVISDYLTHRLRGNEESTADRLAQIYEAAYGLYLEPDEATADVGEAGGEAAGADASADADTDTKARGMAAKTLDRESIAWMQGDGSSRDQVSPPDWFD